MKYPKDIGKDVWDRMVDYTKNWGYMIIFLAVIFIIFMVLKDVI